jgi:hypothetical protein
VTRRPLEWWVSIVRLLAVPFAVLQVWLTHGYPRGYEATAWALTAVLAIAAIVLFATVRDTPAYRRIAMLVDFAIVAGFVILYGFELGTPTRQLLFLVIVVGSARFGMRGGIAVALASVPVSAVFEQQRAHWFHVGYRLEFVTF